MKKYAVQKIDNGQVIDYVDSPEQASLATKKNPLLLTGES